MTEIQRVWSLHNVLLTLDYTSEDNKEMIDLLLQCFNRPVFIKNDDVRCDSVALCLLVALLSCCVTLCLSSQGKRFLVFLFSWNISFIWLIHSTIKNQLEFYSK